VPFGEPGIQVITLLLISLAAISALAGMALGLLSVLTARDPLPHSLRSRMRRIPASAEDFRLRGTGLMLNGAAAMLIVADLTINIVTPLALIPPGLGYYTTESMAIPKGAMFLVTAVAAMAAVTLFVGAYVVSVRVRYVDTRPLDGHRPEAPPA
jgi:hypothetical protein